MIYINWYNKKLLCKINWFWCVMEACSKLRAIWQMFYSWSLLWSRPNHHDNIESGKSRFCIVWSINSERCVLFHLLCKSLKYQPNFSGPTSLDWYRPEQLVEKAYVIVINFYFIANKIEQLCCINLISDSCLLLLLYLFAVLYVLFSRNMKQPCDFCFYRKKWIFWFYVNKNHV